MKKILIVVLAVVAVLVIWGISINNRLVAADEAVSSAWSQVENVCQRRLDLIPNLVSTVKGAANFEKSTFTEVVQARNQASALSIDQSKLSESDVAAYQNAHDNVGAALSRAISVTVEQYPQLTATQAFRDLQTQLEGTENRIAVERNKFNEVVKSYNTSIRRFPSSVIAAIGGFTPKGYFTAASSAHANQGDAAAAPEVSFE